jgi:8-oxo-dGTP pyrophosphatase MutT (NUDIX family)
MPKTCDNASVGVIITNDAGAFLMFERATFPPGIAPVAGHVDTHGTTRQAAEAEVREEVGLTVLSLSEITTAWRNNRCRRHPGPRGTGHHWTIYHAVVTGDLDPSERETRNARWIPRDQLQVLADSTSAYARGGLTDSEFTAQPGLEPVWVQWLYEEGIITLSAGELRLIDELANTSAPTEQP